MFNIQKIKNSYYDLLYEYCEELINEQTIIYESNFINVSKYFSDIPEKLTKFITRQVLQAFNNKQALIKIPIKLIIKFLDKYIIKDYRGFHSYLNVLEKNSGYLAVQLIGQQNCYYQPPELFNIEKIRIFDKNIDPFKLVILDTQYQHFLKQKFKQVHYFNDVLKIIKDNTDNIQDWGTIGIYSQYCKNDKIELSFKISHQLTHFFNYLVRISGINYNMCMYYSNLPHNDYDEILLSNGNYAERVNYYLDENEFKTNSQTFIDKILYSFFLNQKEINVENAELYLNTLFSICFKHKIVNHKYLSIIMNSSWIRYFQDFINIIFNDKNIKTNFGRNNFKIFKKWIIHSFNKQFNIKLNFNCINI